MALIILASRDYPDVDELRSRVGAEPEAACQVRLADTDTSDGGLSRGAKKPTVRPVDHGSPIQMASPKRSQRRLLQQYPLKSRHSPRRGPCPLSAKSGHFDF